MNTKIILSIALVLVVLAGVLTGCSGDTKTTSPVTSTSQSSPTASVTATSPAAETTAATRTITDHKKRTVTIPVNLERVICINSYITFTSIVLGAGDKLAAVETSCMNNTTLNKIYPDLAKKEAFGYEEAPNFEILLKNKPQAILTVAWAKNVADLESKTNLPVICINMDDSRLSTEFIGDLLGKQVKAKEYTDYYDKQMALIKSVVSGAAAQPKVYIACGNKAGGLQTTWAKSSTWARDIVDCGGVYVADFAGGGTKEVSEEQLITWDPDIIILDQSCFESKTSVMSNARWASLKAVKNQAVYRGPDGYISTFGRPHIEAILCRLWITDKFYPGKLGIDMMKTAGDFYSQFYGVKLTDEELKKRMMPED